MNIFISPSNNRLLAKANISISTHSLVEKKNKNQNFEIIISFCCQTLFLIYSLHFTKKHYHSLTKYFEITFSLVLDWACNLGNRGREGAGQLNSSTGFQILAHYFFQMALKDTKLDSNRVQTAIFFFRKSIKIAWQHGALSSDQRWNRSGFSRPDR